MNPDPRADSSLTIETVRHVDGLCTVFERQWREGVRPVIGQILERHSGADRSILLRELLALELEYRRLAGERPQPEEYRRRFPQDRDIVDLVFREADDSPSLGDQANGSQTVGADLPRMFGDYRLIEEIDRGGMGVVYKARQTSLDRLVALKMTRGGALTSAVEMERFCIEAQAAAQLEHPNIVPIIEVGQCQGQRFFSMAYVDGVSLASRLAEGPMAPNEAAELLIAVANAVHYAHTRGVIHRDLKPANILLNAGGKPHITDFGLAKRVSGNDGLTATGEVIGTPSFMPPEQATGKTGLIDGTSDVYALGAVLYMALVGRPPFQAATAVDTLKQVVEQEPVAPRQLDPALPRDLETIALKCLEKSPSARYGSAQQVADELGRYLSGKPILARPTRPLERARRWCRRNPAVASLVGLVSLLLVAVSVTSIGAALHISRLRDEAVERQQQASANLIRAESEQERAESERTRAERNLHFAHQMVRQLADSYSLLGDQQPQVGERLQWYEKAHSLLGTLARENPSTLDPQAELAGSFSRIGILRARAGQDKQAMKAFDQAVEILDRLCQERPELPQYQSELAKACNYLGRQYAADKQNDAALGQYQQACRFQERLLAASLPHSTQIQKDLAHYYADLGELQYDVDHFVDSRASYERALFHLQPIAEQHPDDDELQASLAGLYAAIGMRHFWGDDKDWLNRAESILAALVRAHPEVIRYRIILAAVFTETAKRQSQPASALAEQRKAHDALDQLAHDFPDDPDVQVRVMLSLRDDARFLRFVGYRREAIDALKHALDKCRVLVTPDSAAVFVDFQADVLALLARSQLQEGDIASYRDSCHAMLDRCRARNCYTFDSLRVCMLLPDAVDDHQQLVDLAKDAVSAGSRTLRKPANEGAALYRAAKYEEAIRVLKIVDNSNRMALFARLGTAQLVRADNARVAIFLAMSYARLGHHDVASSWLVKARVWIDGEGQAFAPMPAPGTALDSPTSETNAADPPTGVAGAMALTRLKADELAAKPPPVEPDLEDRMFLADIVFEVQILLREAESFVASTAQAPP